MRQDLCWSAQKLRLRDVRILLTCRLKFSGVYIYFLITWRIIGLGIWIHIWCWHWTHEFSRVDVQTQCWKLWMNKILGLNYLVVERGSRGFIELVYFVWLIQSVRRYEVFSGNHYWRSLRLYLWQTNVILFSTVWLSRPIINWIIYRSSR